MAVFYTENGCHNKMHIENSTVKIINNPHEEIGSVHGKRNRYFHCNFYRQNKTFIKNLIFVLK